MKSTLYKYETHLHTAGVSKCAHASGAEQAEYYASLGYAGIVVTDHFFNGNCGVPKDLPWEERVDLFAAGYRDAYEAGKKLGLDVFFGWEYSLMGTDFLTYGLSVDWLKENPQIMEMKFKEYSAYVHECGGVIIHAHPFREASYISMIRLAPRDVDGVEIVNANRTPFENLMANEYAKNYDLIAFAGSDNHSASLQKRHAGVMTKSRIESMDDFVDMIREKDFKIFTEGLEK